MSKWTHSICDACWAARHPDREAVRVRTLPLEQCCYRGQTNMSGIYVRGDPETLQCRGIHAEDKEV